MIATIKINAKIKGLLVFIDSLQKSIPQQYSRGNYPLPDLQLLPIINCMSLSLDLWRLQRIDTAIDQSRTRIRAIEEVIKSDTKLKEAEAAQKTAQENYHNAARVQKKAEDTAEALRIKIETSESNLYGGRIQIPKELKDLQNEVISLKKRLKELEDELLTAMIETETTETNLSDSQKTVATTLALVTSQFSTLAGEKTSLENKIASLFNERQSAISSIPTDTLDLYKRLREQKKGIAVSHVEDESCSTCGAALRPAEWQAARSPGAVVFCSSCGRILYAD